MAADQKAKGDLFGFLPCRYGIEFDGGNISPVSNLSELEAWVKRQTNDDGFLYPPLVKQASESGEVIPRTERPAHLYKIPPSHEVVLRASGAILDLRKGPSGFIVQLLAYLFGTRLQFHDWWFDGRIPLRPTHSITFTESTVAHFLSHCYRIWQTWTQEEQKLATNILYMHSRASSYEWDWERFMIEYMVLDGCYNVAKARHGVSAQRHEERIKVLCSKFSIPPNMELVKNIVDLRNDLFHETLWDKSQPGTAASESAFYQSFNLRRLNQRLIPALLGYTNSYVRTSWWVMGTCTFDQP